jgi:MFS family permease
VKLTVSNNNRFRLFFALQFAGVGIFFPYAALYLTSIGLSGGQIGLLLAIVPLISFLVQPLWGFVSDLHHLHRQALVFACLGVVVSMIGFALTEEFWLLLFFAILHAVMKAPIGILVTSLALEHLERERSRVGFGSFRLWGSIGFAVASFGVGALLVNNAIWWIIPLYGLSNLTLAAIGLTIPNATLHDESRWQDAFLLLRRERTLIGFLLGALLVGFTLGIVNNYLAVYLTDIEAAGWVIGTALAISALLEVPLMANVPAFIKRWGIRLVLVTGIAMLPIRWLLYVFIDQPLLVLPTQVLHSIAMMSLLVVGVLYVDRLLNPKWRASGQALYAASLHGVGPSIGLLAAGLIYQQAGITPVWLLCFLVASLGTVIIGFVVYRHPARQPQPEVTPYEC